MNQLFFRLWKPALAIITLLSFISATSGYAFYAGKQVSKPSTTPVIEFTTNPGSKHTQTPTPSSTPIPHAKTLTSSQKDLLSLTELRLKEIDEEIQDKQNRRVFLAERLLISLEENCKDDDVCLNPTDVFNAFAPSIKGIDLDLDVLIAEKNLLLVQKTSILSSVGQ